MTTGRKAVNDIERAVKRNMEGERQKVLDLLRESEPLGFSAIQEALRTPDSALGIALGYLLKEGKVENASGGWFATN